MFLLLQGTEVAAISVALHPLACVAMQCTADLAEYLASKLLIRSIVIVVMLANKLA